MQRCSCKIKESMQILQEFLNHLQHAWLRKWKMKVNDEWISSSYLKRHIFLKICRTNAKPVKVFIRPPPATVVEKMEKPMHRGNCSHKIKIPIGILRTSQAALVEKMEKESKWIKINSRFIFSYRREKHVSQELIVIRKFPWRHLNAFRNTFSHFLKYFL